jgi:hypothetical protein
LSICPRGSEAYEEWAVSDDDPTYTRGPSSNVIFVFGPCVLCTCVVCQAIAKEALIMGYLTDTRFDIVMSNYVAKVREPLT